MAIAKFIGEEGPVLGTVLDTNDRFQATPVLNVFVSSVMPERLLTVVARDYRTGNVTDYEVGPSLASSPTGWVFSLPSFVGSYIVFGEALEKNSVNGEGFSAEYLRAYADTLIGRPTDPDEALATIEGLRRRMPARGRIAAIYIKNKSEVYFTNIAHSHKSAKDQTKLSVIHYYNALELANVYNTHLPLGVTDSSIITNILLPFSVGSLTSFQEYLNSNLYLLNMVRNGKQDEVFKALAIIVNEFQATEANAYSTFALKVIPYSKESMIRRVVNSIGKMVGKYVPTETGILVDKNGRTLLP